MTGTSVEKLIAEQEKRLAKQFHEIEKVALFNQEKVLSAFREEQIALRHFNPSTGYGYGDDGRAASFAARGTVRSKISAFRTSICPFSKAGTPTTIQRTAFCVLKRCA